DTFIDIGILTENDLIGMADKNIVEYYLGGYPGYCKLYTDIYKMNNWRYIIVSMISSKINEDFENIKRILKAMKLQHIETTLYNEILNLEHWDQKQFQVLKIQDLLQFGSIIKARNDDYVQIR